MNLVLVGFMGSGKTSVGRRVAMRLGYGFLDTDHFIESEVGCTIQEIFSIQGEAYFRKLENRLADRLRLLENTVISTGGGMTITAGNLERLRTAGVVIFLKASMEDILKRLERDTRRPKIKGGDLRENVTRLLEERLPLYERSDIVVETKGKNIHNVCREIVRKAGNFRPEDRSPLPEIPPP